jgi:DNA processing protein
VIEARTVQRGNPEYPELLQELTDPPDRIFVAGRTLEPAPFVAIVGSRRPSRYGVEVATWLARELSSLGVVVVSGMAGGIDAAAHRGALEARGHTVAVLGSGIDVCYPPRNRALYREISDQGTLATEYEGGTPPLPHHFPTRNRIIAGMSYGAVIVEGRLGGGAMITARLASEFGREVFAVPGPVHSPQSEGPHALIRDGARLVTCPADVLDELALSKPLQEALPLELAPDERNVLCAIEATPTLLDTLAQLAGLPPSTTAAVLARLELRGIVTRHPGGRFGRSPSV